MDESHYFPRQLSGRANVLSEHSLILAWTSCICAKRCASCLCRSRIFSSLLLLWLIREINTEMRKGARCPGKWEVWIVESERGRRARASECGVENESLNLYVVDLLARGTMESPQHSAVAKTNHIVTQPQMPSLVGINTHQQTPLCPAMACAQSSWQSGLKAAAS